MAQLTLGQARRQMSTWLQASLDVAEGKTVSISSSSGLRTLTYENAEEIRKQIIFWQEQINRLSNANPIPRHSIVSFNE